MRADDDGGAPVADVRERRCARLGRLPPRRAATTSTPSGSNQRRKFCACWSASSSVGAISATWRPPSTASVAASAATSVLPQPTSPCTRRSIGLAQLQVRSTSLEHPLLRPGRPKRQRGEQSRFERAGAGAAASPGRRCTRRAQQLERELMREQFLEREPPLGRVPPIDQQIHRRVRRRPMHVVQGLAQARQMRIGEHCGGQPVLQIAGGGLIERQPDQLPQASLGDALGARGRSASDALRRRGAAAGSMRRYSGCTISKPCGPRRASPKQRTRTPRAQARCCCCAVK